MDSTCCSDHWRGGPGRGLGYLEAERDWSHAKECVEVVGMILQADAPGDFVFAIGETRLVREMVELSFAQVGRHIEWRGAGVADAKRDIANGKRTV